MALADKRLTDITYIPSSAGSVFTNPSGKKTRIKLITIHNTTNVTETVSIWRVPDSGGSLGTASDANRIYKDVLAPDETVILEFGAHGMILEDTNDSIQASTTSANEVTIAIDGLQEP